MIAETYICFACITDIATVSPLNNTIVREENTTTITCETFGYPPPTVVWNRINGNFSDRVSVSDSVSVLTGNGNITRVSVNLTITAAYREDTGDYICTANNSIGSEDRNFSLGISLPFILTSTLRRFFSLGCHLSTFLGEKQFTKRLAKFVSLWKNFRFMLRTSISTIGLSLCMIPAAPCKTDSSQPSTSM